MDIVSLILIYKMFHFLFLSYFNQDSDYKKTVHYDSLRIIINKFKFNYFGAEVSVCILFYSYHLIRNPNLKIYFYLEEILIEKSIEYFIDPTYKNKSITELIRKCFLTILNIYQIMLINVGKFMIIFI